uniref:Uncharacterized protein n=1 Tax=Romanomermis culicivorax TaxID=13658 RepID=A0A915HU60_ROMCU
FKNSPKENCRLVVGEHVVGLQTKAIVDVPWQLRPPFEGGGLLQERTDFDRAMPLVNVEQRHDWQFGGDHEDHEPSTGWAMQPAAWYNYLMSSVLTAYAGLAFIFILLQLMSIGYPFKLLIKRLASCNSRHVLLKKVELMSAAVGKLILHIGLNSRRSLTVEKDHIHTLDSSTILDEIKEPR